MTTKGEAGDMYLLYKESNSTRLNPNIRREYIKTAPQSLEGISWSRLQDIKGGFTYTTDPTEALEVSKEAGAKITGLMVDYDYHIFCIMKGWCNDG